MESIRRKLKKLFKDYKNWLGVLAVLVFSIIIVVGLIREIEKNNIILEQLNQPQNITLHKNNDVKKPPHRSLNTDYVKMVVTYTPPPTLTAPSDVTLNSYELGGVEGYSVTNFYDTHSIEVTASADFTVQVISTKLSGPDSNEISASNVKLVTTYDDAGANNPTKISCADGTATIVEYGIQNGDTEQSLDTAKEILHTTDTSGSVSCDIYPTIKVIISNFLRAGDYTGTLTFTVS